MHVYAFSEGFTVVGERLALEEIALDLRVTLRYKMKLVGCMLSLDSCDKCKN